MPMMPILPYEFIWYRGTKGDYIFIRGSNGTGYATRNPFANGLRKTERVGYPFNPFNPFELFGFCSAYTRRFWLGFEAAIEPLSAAKTSKKAP